MVALEISNLTSLEMSKHIGRDVPPSGIKIRAFGLQNILISSNDPRTLPMSALMGISLSLISAINGSVRFVANIVFNVANVVSSVRVRIPSVPTAATTGGSLSAFKVIGWFPPVDSFILTLVRSTTSE